MNLAQGNNVDGKKKLIPNSNKLYKSVQWQINFIDDALWTRIIIVPWIRRRQ